MDRYKIKDSHRDISNLISKAFICLILLTEKLVLYGANFGRDADTIASMAGAIAGAYQGAKALPDEWKDKVQQKTELDQIKLSNDLISVIRQRLDEMSAIVKVMDGT
jgi:ADP-ribosylglycohydrolase